MKMIKKLVIKIFKKKEKVQESNKKVLIKMNKKENLQENQLAIKLLIKNQFFKNYLKKKILIIDRLKI